MLGSPASIGLSASSCCSETPSSVALDRVSSCISVRWSSFQSHWSSCGRIRLGPKNTSEVWHPEPTMRMAHVSRPPFRDNEGDEDVHQAKAKEDDSARQYAR